MVSIVGGRSQSTNQSRLSNATPNADRGQCVEVVGGGAAGTVTLEPGTHGYNGRERDGYQPEKADDPDSPCAPRPEFHRDHLRVVGAIASTAASG